MSKSSSCRTCGGTGVIYDRDELAGPLADFCPACNPDVCTDCGKTSCVCPPLPHCTNHPQAMLGCADCRSAA